MKAKPTPISLNLSPARKALVRIFWRLSFGRLEDLRFCHAEPILDSPAPRIIQTLRFGAMEGPGSLPSLEEIASRPAVQQLMAVMDRLGTGRFTRLEIRAGSPVFSEIEIAPAEGGPHV